MIDELVRGIEQLLERIGGALNFRLVIQPIVAISLALSAGIRDARNNKPAYLWEVVTNRAERRILLASAWKDLGRLIIACFLIDSIYQLIVLRHFYPLQVVIVVLVLAVIPYILVRGPTTRLIRRYKRMKASKTEIITQEENKNG